MEYYIMQLYEYKKKEKGLKLGLNRFSKKMKWIVIILLVVMFILSITTFILILLFPKDNRFLFVAIPNIMIMIMLLILDNKDQTINTDQHTEEYIKKIKLLQDIIKEFNIDSRDKIILLIQKYNQYINKRNEEEKARNKIIVTLFSALSGLLSITFLNLDIIGINFYLWLYLAVFLLLSLCLASMCIYLYRYLDALKYHYENMVNDLESLIIYKY